MKLFSNDPIYLFARLGNGIYYINLHNNTDLLKNSIISQFETMQNCKVKMRLLKLGKWNHQKAQRTT